MNWKDPVFNAFNTNGEYMEDPDGISKFHSYKCELPSGLVIDRSARFFSFGAFVFTIARWNKMGNGRYKYFYDSMDIGSYGLPDPNSKEVNPPARESTTPKITGIGMIRNGKVLFNEAL